MHARSDHSSVDLSNSKNFEEVSSSTRSERSWWGRYRWRMRHYFYIHVSIFIFNGLLGGFVVYLIENYIKPNRRMRVHYIDTWFVAASCVYNCGLTTLDFARLSRCSQVILMIFTLASGITTSTLPALIIKASTHKREQGIRVDDDHSAYYVSSQSEKTQKYSLKAEIKIARLPNAEQLRFRAYLSCLILIPLTCMTIYVLAYLSIGSWIHRHYRPYQLRQDGRPVNPWYASFIITVTGFNQNGLTPWSDNLMRFVDDVVLNILVMLLIVSGNSLFPLIFRNVIMLVRWLVPWHRKVIFEYILLNNHRLSTVLYPTIQTRIYLTVTFGLYALGISVSLILDYSSQTFAQYSSSNRFLIFAFQTIASRFAGFQTIDITLFVQGTLIIYLLLMAVKPQMLCALDRSPFELEWQTIRDKETVFLEAKRRQRTTSDGSDGNSSVYPIRHLSRVLRSHSLDARLRAERHFFLVTSHMHLSSTHSRKATWIKLHLFLSLMARRMLFHSLTLFTRTRTWLFVAIFLICALEHYHITPIDENVTVFKIVFEVVSAFGAVGLTTGYPNLKSSFATVLSSSSKIVLIFTMLMGRHRPSRARYVIERSKPSRTPRENRPAY